LIERTDDRLEVDPAATRGAEVPAAARIAEAEVACEDAGAAVEGGDRVLDVDVIDAIGEGAEKLDRIDPLPVEVAGIEVESELLAAAERLESALGGDQIVGDLRGVDLEREADATFGEDVGTGGKP
jgi:hypothetical protein